MTSVQPVAPSNLTPEHLALLAGLLAAPDSPAWARARDAARMTTPRDWSVLLPVVTAHELVPRLLGCAVALGLSLPPALLDRLAELQRLARARAKRGQFTVYRFLRAAQARGLPTILLKGTALVGTHYPAADERHMVDVDVLVPRRHLGAARAVARAIGLGPGRRALPGFFYTLVHFEQVLQPWLDGMVPLDLHWRLHSPALLLTTDGKSLWQRRQTCTLYGCATATLASNDQWLHLATHFWSHWGTIPTGIGHAELAAILADPAGAVQVKWVRDLVVATELLASATPPAELAARAVEWSATRQTEAALLLVQPLLSPTCLRFAIAVAEATARATGPAPVQRAEGRGAARWQGDAAHQALGFRPRSLGRLLSWLWPPTAYLRASIRVRGGAATRRTLITARVAHTAAAFGRVLVGTLALPIAFAVGCFSAPWRAAARARARRPDRVFELVRSAGEFEKAYAARFPARGGAPGG